MRFNLLRRGPLVPESVLLKLGQEHPRTPDYYDLCLRNELLVFVADEMMRGHRAELHKDFATRYGVAFTDEPYLMFKNNLGKFTFPVILKKDPEYCRTGIMSRASPFPIRGELWKIKPEFIVALDNWKQNGDTFTRQIVSVNVPFRRKFERDFAQSTEDVRRVRNGIVEGTEILFGENEVCKVDGVFMYLANPERFFWEAQGNPDFISMKPIKSTDKLRKPYYYFGDVNGIQNHQPHSPTMVPHVAVRTDAKELKNKLLKNHGQNAWFVKQQKKRADEAAREAAKP